MGGGTKLAWGVLVGAALAAGAATALAGTDAAREAESAAITKAGDETQAWRVQRQKVLDNRGERDLLAFSDDLLKHIDTADGPTADAAIEVFVKAGQPDRVPAAARRLRDLKPPAGCLGGTVICLSEHRLWDSLHILLDKRPDIAPFGRYLVAEYLKHWRQTASHDKVEAWLKVRYQANWQEWSSYYFEYLAAEGTLAPLVAQRRQEILKAPDDYALVCDYLLAQSRLPEKDRPEKAIAWLGDVSRPKYATNAFEVAEALREKKCWAEAVKLLDHSLTLPFTAYDFDWLYHHYHLATMDVKEEEPMFRRGTKAELATCCKESGDLKRAQKLAEELVGPNAALTDLDTLLLGGGIQAATGQLVIEKRVLAAEVENKTSVWYWLGRATYYTGRGEDDKAEEALHKALALPPDEARSSAIEDNFHWLTKRHRYPEAEKLIRDELARVGVKDRPGMADRLVSDLVWLANEDHIKVPPDEPIFWQFLAEPGPYRDTHVQIMAFFLNKAPAADRAAVIARLVKLAGPDGDPSRSYWTGRVLLSREFTAQAKPLLEDALARGKYDWSSEHPVRLLYELHLRQGEWQTAEKYLRQYRAGRGSIYDEDLLDLLGRLAVCAAKDGDKAAAIRLWTERTNVDLGNLKCLGDMVAAGMKDPLKEFYAGLAKRAPDSTAVAAALSALEKP